jgi:hypothetical protein
MTRQFLATFEQIWQDQEKVEDVTDQVIEHILHENPGVRLVRLGGRTKKESILPYVMGSMWKQGKKWLKTSSVTVAVWWK